MYHKCKTFTVTSNTHTVTHHSSVNSNNYHSVHEQSYCNSCVNSFVHVIIPGDRGSHRGVKTNKDPTSLQPHRRYRETSIKGLSERRMTLYKVHFQ